MPPLLRLLPSLLWGARTRPARTIGFDQLLQLLLATDGAPERTVALLGALAQHLADAPAGVGGGDEDEDEGGGGGGVADPAASTVQSAPPPSSC